MHHLKDSFRKCCLLELFPKCLRCLCTLPCYFAMRTCIVQLSTNNFWRIRTASELVHVPRTSLPEDFPPYMLLPNRALRAWAALMPSLQSIVHGWRESPWRGTRSEYQHFMHTSTENTLFVFRNAAGLWARLSAQCVKLPQTRLRICDKTFSSRPAPSKQL